MRYCLREMRLTTLLLISLLLLHVLAYAPLSDDTILNRLAQPDTADFDIHTGNLLAPILIPRVPGTEGSRKVLQHFVEFFRNSLPAWTVTFQNSTSKTPTHGDNEVPFVNLIATRDPPWAASGNVGRLNLVAHYDSKYQPEGFIGATDSAAPCAMIMHAVRAIDAALTRKWDTMQAQGSTDPDFDEQKGIQVLLLDGEEAFRSWTATDSIYGARSLAEEWEHTMHPATSIYKTFLDSIELFVLLDLLGVSEDLPIPSWQHTSHWSYVHMAEAELRLRKLNLFRSKSRTWLPEKDKKETDGFQSYVMQDDHIPFIARGVQVLHLIPARFPSVWHTINDDAEHLDIPTVEDWAFLTAVFAAEYMELEGFFEQNPASQMMSRDDDDLIISKAEHRYYVLDFFTECEDTGHPYETSSRAAGLRYLDIRNYPRAENPHICWRKQPQHRGAVSDQGFRGWEGSRIKAPKSPSSKSVISAFQQNVGDSKSQPQAPRLATNPFTIIAHRGRGRGRD